MQSHLQQRIFRLVKVRGKRQVELWMEMIDGNDFEALVRSLIIDHYDKTYRKGKAADRQEVKIDWPENMSLKREDIENSIFLRELSKIRQNVTHT